MRGLEEATNISRSVKTAFNGLTILRHGSKDSSVTSRLFFEQQSAANSTKKPAQFN
jgi:hypothetical protein